MCQLALGHFFLHGNHKPSDVWFDTDTLIRTLIDFQRRYRFDGFLINLPGRPPGWKQYLADYQQDDQGETLTWKSGLVTRVPPDDNPHTFLGDGRPLPRADYAKVDPARSGDVSHRRLRMEHVACSGFVGCSRRRGSDRSGGLSRLVHARPARPERLARTCRFTWRSFRRLRT